MNGHSLISKIFILTMFITGLSAMPVLASGGGVVADFDSTSLVKNTMGYLAILLFVVAYCLVIFEEQLHLRKSKPVMMAAGIIWVMVATTYIGLDMPNHAGIAIRHNLLEYAELFLFLLAAMTYINAMDERNVFQALRTWLVGRGFSLRTIFWLTGLLAFVISPIADNLTTALLMGAVAMAVGGDNKKFVALACINIVVAANAGGAFSPFGDITTLMVWQKGKVEFAQFFAIFIPSVVNWLVPAIVMNMAIGKESPAMVEENYKMKLGAKRIIFLFLCTITTAVSFHNYLHLPPAAGMMLGLAYLGFFSYYLKKTEQRAFDVDDNPLGLQTDHTRPIAFDLFRKVARAEWDTLLFFYGVIRFRFFLETVSDRRGGGQPTFHRFCRWGGSYGFCPGDLHLWGPPEMDPIHCPRLWCLDLCPSYG